MTGLVTCAIDAGALLDLCAARGGSQAVPEVRRFHLPCVGRIGGEYHLLSQEASCLPDALQVSVLNPELAKEKTRLLQKLEIISSRLSHAVYLLEESGTDDAEQRGGELDQVMDILSADLEDSQYRAKSSKETMDEDLDWLVLMELSEEAPPKAHKEGLWLLKHLRPKEYEDTQPDGELILARRHFEMRVFDRDCTPSAENLAEARQRVLGVFGRQHMESVLAHRLELATAALRKYTKGEITRSEALEVLGTQIQAVCRLSRKRSLIGCFFIDFADLPFNSDVSSSTEDLSSPDGNSDGAVTMSFDDNEDTDTSDIELEDNPEEDEEDFEEEEEEHIMLEEEQQQEEEEEDQMSPRTPEQEHEKRPGAKGQDVKEETPLSATTFVSTNSEIGDVAYWAELDQEENANSAELKCCSSSPGPRDAPEASDRNPSVGTNKTAIVSGITGKPCAPTSDSGAAPAGHDKSGAPDADKGDDKSGTPNAEKGDDKSDTPGAEKGGDKSDTPDSEKGDDKSDTPGAEKGDDKSDTPDS